MVRIEELREKLHVALKKGNSKQILAISQELDKEIVNFMLDSIKHKRDIPTRWFSSFSKQKECCCKCG